MRKTKSFLPIFQSRVLYKKLSLLFILISLCSSFSYAQTFSVNNDGADDICASAWPQEILGNYYENGTNNSKPCYEGPDGYWLYHANMSAGVGASWVVGKPLGSTDINGANIRHYKQSTASTPPLNTRFTSSPNGCGYIKISDEGAVAPPAPTLYNPSSVGASSMNLSWSRAPGATGYNVYVSTNSSFTALVSGLDPKDVPKGAGDPYAPTSTTISGLSRGTKYYIRVRTYSGAGESGNSNTVSATTAPNAPVANNATNISDITFKANWDAASGATSYKLYVSTNSGFSSHISGYNGKSVGNTTSYNVTGLSGNTTYYYRLKASNSAGESGYSNTKSLTTAPPAPVVNDATAITKNSFSANWSASSQATTYFLDVATNSNFSTKVSGYDNKNVGNVTTSSVTGLSTGTTYYFRVRAYNAIGTSSNSSSKSLITIPGEPTATSGTSIQQTSFSANWNSTTGATAYKLDVATDAGFSTLVSGYNNLDVSNVTTYSVNTNLTSNTTYYYRVRAYNSAGTGSNSNTITLTTAPNPPTTQAHSIIFSNIGPAQMKIDWTNGNGAKRVVFIKEGNTGDASPEDYTTYSADTKFKSGTQIGATSWYCIYNGTGTTVTVNSLMPETTYQVMVCEYNGATDLETYNSNSATDNPSNQTTQTILINEVNADSEGKDTEDFVELYDGGNGNTSLDYLTVVLWNGGTDVSYRAIDLDGYSTDANGYFVIGNSAVPGVDITFPDNTLQNGSDAVALYLADNTDFPGGTAITTTNIIDAIVYDTDDADDAALLVLLNGGEPQVNERNRGDSELHSLQRIPNGEGGYRNTSSYAAEEPTPDAANVTVSVITVEGNSTLISDGDVTPDASDHTAFINVSINGDSSTRTYTIKNSGLATLNIDSVRISGTHGSDFSITTNPNTTVAASGSTTFIVKFDPSAVGTRSAMLNIYNNDVDRTPYNFNIQGDGLIPEINLQGNSTTIADGDTIPTTTDHTDFGNQDVASGTVSRTFTIQNTGTGVLKLGTNAVSLSGGQSGDFSITAQPATTVASSGSSTFIIQFDPSVMGERKTTVSINSDDSDENPYNFSIKGNGLSPEISISGNSIEITDGDTTPSTTDYTDFGSLLVASETLSRTFTVTNSGNSALTLTGTPHIAINGVNAADFTITVDATSPVASSGGTTTFTVRFDPSATGTRTASITIDNNDTNENPYNFEIEGLGHSLPTVTADAATNVVQKSATLNGTVNANDDTTTVVFEYGLTTGYGSTVTANPDTITGHTDTSVSKSVSGLTPSTTYHYRVVGNNSAGTSNGNDQAFTTLDCINPTAAGTIGNAQQICNGSNPSEISSLSLPSGNSGVLEYKWQQSTTSSTTGFSDISNSNSTTYDPSNLTTTTWYKRLVRVDCKNDWSGALESNAIKITVLLLMEAGTISANQSICYNTVPTKLTGVAPTGGKAPYTYQWQSSTDGINFSDISGETNLDYQAPALTTTTYYQLEQTSSSGCGTVSTNVVKIKVYGEFTVGSIPGFKVIYYRNAPEKFIGVAPTGGKQPYSYQWQSSTNGTKFTDIYGATSLDYQAGRLRRTTYFQLKQSSASGCGIFTTNRLTVVVFPKFIVGSISADQHIAYNSAPEKLIGEKPRGGRQPYSYQWQSSGDGINFTNIVGATKLDYQPGTLTDTTYFQLIQSSSHDYAEKNTNMVSIYVYPEFKVGSISEDQNVCYNSAPDMLMGTEPSGGNLPYTYQWQSSTDGINFTDIAGASLLNYRPNVLTETTYFQQIQTSANACGSFTTNIVTMGIKLPPTVFSGNDVAGICANEDYQLSGSVENYESLVWTTSGDGSFSDINVLNPVYTPGSNDNINGSATLTLIANPEAPCSNPVSDELILSFNQIPLVDAGNDLTIYENSQVQITASVQGNGNYSYSWSPAAMLSDPTILNPLTNPISETTTFTIEVSDNETGCVVEDQVTFKVETGVTYQISGSISSTNLKNSLPVTEVYFTGIQEKTTTNNLGEYTMLVPAGYSGWAIPLRPGYIFEPDSIPFFNVGVDIVDQNYGGILYINAFAEPDTLILELGQSSQLGVELIGSQDPITDYRWFDQDGNLQSSEANPIVEPTETTLYTVYVEDALERSYDTVRVTVVSNVGIDDLNNNNQISIYPNPAKDLLYIDIGTLKVADNLIITITDLNGKIMFREDVKDTISEIDVSTFKPSLYFVEIRTSENSKKLKLIIE